MRYPKGQREKTRAKILDAAMRLFKRNGFAATGVDAVMAAVDMTAGAFYGHFASKDALFAEAIDVALVRVGRRVDDEGFDVSRLRRQAGHVETRSAGESPPIRFRRGFQSHRVQPGKHERVDRIVHLQRRGG